VLLPYFWNWRIRKERCFTNEIEQEKQARPEGRDVISAISRLSLAPGLWGCLLYL